MHHPGDGDRVGRAAGRDGIVGCRMQVEALGVQPGHRGWPVGQLRPRRGRLHGDRRLTSRHLPAGSAEGMRGSSSASARWLRPVGLLVCCGQGPGMLTDEVVQPVAAGAVSVSR